MNMDIWGSMSLQINQILFYSICCLSNSIRFFADWHDDVDAKPYDDENTEEVEVYTNPFVSLKIM